MNRRILFTFLLMMMLAAASAAQMNFDLESPYIRYTKMDEEDAMPVLIDVIDEAIDPDEAQSVIGGADGPTAIFVAESAGQQEQTWPKTFTITLAGDTTLGSTDDLRKRSDCFENVAAEKGYGWFFSGLEPLFVWAQQFHLDFYSYSTIRLWFMW